MAGRIVVVGSSNTDMIVRVPHLPAPGETVLGNHFTQVPGGKGANQAVAAARAGGKVTLIACVGEDTLGGRALDGYFAEGIDIRYIRQDPAVASGVAMISVAADGQNSIAVASGANARLSPTDVQRAAEAIREADVLLVQLEVPIETVREAIQIAHAAGVRIILDPAPAPELGLPVELLKMVHILTPDESEATRLTGINVVGTLGAPEAAVALRRFGPQSVLVSLGAAGAWLNDDSTEQLIPAFPTEVVDTTAAGDTRNGAMAVALAEGQSFCQAATFGSAAAAISVSRAGAQPSIPRRDEIDKRLKVAAT